MRKIIVLVAAIALVAGVVVYAKKRESAACPCIQGSSFILITATSNNDIHAIVPIRLIIEMAVSVAPVLFLFNYLMDRQFHKLDGIKARIDGLRSLMKSEYSSLMESEQKKLKDFQTKY